MNYGMGVVFTPPLMADLMASIAQVNKDSIVLDICAGKGDLLKAAIRKGCEQLIGVEIRPEIHAIANDAVNGRGYVCLMNALSLPDNFVKTDKPNIALLNPPYSLGGDRDEFAFVHKALDLTKPGGQLVALVPLSKAVGTSKANTVWKQLILSKHTLQAVIRLPKKSVDVCLLALLVFEAHKPHLEDYQTWFGDWRDEELFRQDGIADTLRNKYVSNFINRFIIPGISCVRHVNANEAWCGTRIIDD